MSNCVFCKQVNVYIEDIFAINRLLITIFPAERYILRTGTKLCILCYGKVDRLAKFVSHFRDPETNYNDPECCNFCNSEQVFQSSIEAITEAVLQSKLWIKETTPICCGACYWQIDQMGQLKTQLQTITFTLKFKLKPAYVSLIRLSNNQIEAEKLALKPQLPFTSALDEASRKRRSNIKVEKLHYESSESSTKRKSVSFAQSPPKWSEELKEIQDRMPMTKGAQKAFSESDDDSDGELYFLNPDDNSDDSVETPNVQEPIVKKKVKKMTKNRIKKMRIAHGIPDCIVFMDKLSDEKIAHLLSSPPVKRRTASKDQSNMKFRILKPIKPPKLIPIPFTSAPASSESILPDEDIYEEPPKLGRAIKLPKLLCTQTSSESILPNDMNTPKRGRGRPSKKTSVLGSNDSIESILPDEFIKESPIKSPKKGRGKRVRKSKEFTDYEMEAPAKSKGVKPVIPHVYGDDPMSQISAKEKNELLPEQITGILSYLEKHNRSLPIPISSDDKSFLILSKLETKTTSPNGKIEPVGTKSPPPDPMLSTAMLSLPESLIKNQEVKEKNEVTPTKFEDVDNQSTRQDKKQDSEHILRNISFGDTDEIYVINPEDEPLMNGSIIEESLADVTPEPSPCKNSPLSEIIDIEFMNRELLGAPFENQMVEYEELNSETKLLDE